MGYTNRTGTYRNLDYDREFFPTPHNLCVASLKLVPGIESSMHVLDAGAGTGAWGKAFRELNKVVKLTGIEKENLPKPDNNTYNKWIIGDYLELDDRNCYEVIFGNPPFSLAEKFIHQSRKRLYGSGYIVFLLRLAFLEGQKRCETLFELFAPKVVYALPKRPSFTYDGKTGSTAFGIFVWQADYIEETKLRWLIWNDKS